VVIRAQDYVTDLEVFEEDAPEHLDDIDGLADVAPLALTRTVCMPELKMVMQATT
jgi:hypothetical protein